MLKSLNTLMVLMVSVLISTPVLMNSINTSDSLNTITQTTTIPSRSVIEDQFLSFKLTNFTDVLSNTDATKLSAIKISELPEKGTLKLGNKTVTTTQYIPTADINNLGFKPSLNKNGTTTFKWQGFQKNSGVTSNLTSPINFEIAITPVNDTHQFTERLFPKTALEDQKFSFFPTMIEPDLKEYQLKIKQTNSTFITTLIDENMATINSAIINPADTTISAGTVLKTPSFNQNIIYQINYEGTSNIKLKKNDQILHTFTPSTNTYTWQIDQSVPTGDHTFKFICDACTPTFAAVPISENNIFEFGIINKPSWLTINKITGELSGTPNQINVGVNDNIAITASSNGQLVTSSFFNLNVQNNNDKPITYSLPETGSPNITVNEGSEVTITLKGTDEDKDNLRYLVASNALPKYGATVINGNKLTYRHSGKESTIETFQYYAKDKTLTSSASTISIQINAINDIPELDALATIAKHNEQHIVTLNGRDDDLPTGQSLTYQLEEPVTGATIVNNTLRYTFPDSTATSIPEKIDLKVTAMDPANAKSKPAAITIYLYQHNIDATKQLKVPDMIKSISDQTPTGIATTVLDVSNIFDQSDKVNKRYAIQYEISNNNYFSIHKTNGNIYLKNNTFPSNRPTLNVTVYAKASTKDKMVGVFSHIKFKLKKSFNPNIQSNINSAMSENELLIENKTNAILNESFYGTAKNAELSGGGTTTIDHQNGLFNKLFSENGKVINKNNLETKSSTFGDDEGSVSEFFMVGKKFKSDQCTFGNNGTAIANVSSGTTEFKTWIFGQNENGKGSANVSQNAKIIADEIICGQNGSCEFNQLGGEASVEKMTLGKESGASGALNLSKLASINVKELICGDKGRCAITQNNGNLTITKLATTGSGNATIQLSSGNATITEMELNNCGDFKLTGANLKSTLITCNQGSFTNSGGKILVGKEATKKSVTPKQIQLISTFEQSNNTTKIIGDYVQKHGTTPVSDLRMNISGPSDYSQLEVTGKATFDGKLTVTHDSETTFKLNESYQLIKANSIDGSFKSISLPFLGKDLRWDTSDLYATGIVKVSNANQIQVNPVTVYIYPNPVKENTAIASYKLEQSTDVTFQIYDIFGHRIYNTQFKSGENGGRINNNNVNIPTSVLNQLPIGVYFILIHNNNQTLGKGKFAVK